MVISFSKYHGAGNDFVLIDDRSEKFPENDQHLIARICSRRFGVGADGLMLLRGHAEHDFEMVYFNSDGRTSSMCGNGGRCIVAFAHALGMIDKETEFMAIDGLHKARLIAYDQVSLEMTSVNDIEVINESSVLLDTGSPHYVIFTNDISNINLIEQARSIRYADRFKNDGVNVNFVQIEGQSLQIRTYERGVEAETLACGTGVTAAAIAANYLNKVQNSAVDVTAIGGELNVRFIRENDDYMDIWKTGPVAHVFDGKLAVK